MFFADTFSNTLITQYIDSGVAGTLYLALNTDDPGLDADVARASEVIGGGYRRRPVVFAIDGDRKAKIATDTVFSSMPETVVKWFTVWDAQIGGNMLFSGLFPDDGVSLTEGQGLKCPADSIFFSMLPADDPGCSGPSVLDFYSASNSASYGGIDIHGAQWLSPYQQYNNFWIDSAYIAGTPDKVQFEEMWFDGSALQGVYGQKHPAAGITSPEGHGLITVNNSINFTFNQAVGPVSGSDDGIWVLGFMDRSGLSVTEHLWFGRHTVTGGGYDTSGTITQAGWGSEIWTSPTAGTQGIGCRPHFFKDGNGQLWCILSEYAAHSTDAAIAAGAATHNIRSTIAKVEDVGGTSWTLGTQQNLQATQRDTTTGVEIIAGQVLGVEGTTLWLQTTDYPDPVTPYKDYTYYVSVYEYSGTSWDFKDSIAVTAENDGTHSGYIQRDHAVINGKLILDQSVSGHAYDVYSYAAGTITQEAAWTDLDALAVASIGNVDLEAADITGYKSNYLGVALGKLLWGVGFSSSWDGVTNGPAYTAIFELDPVARTVSEPFILWTRAVTAASQTAEEYGEGYLSQNITEVTVNETDYAMIWWGYWGDDDLVGTYVWDDLVTIWNGLPGDATA